MRPQGRSSRPTGRFRIASGQIAQRFPRRLRSSGSDGGVQQRKNITGAILSWACSIRCWTWRVDFVERAFRDDVIFGTKRDVESERRFTAVAIG